MMLDQGTATFAMKSANCLTKNQNEMENNRNHASYVITL